ncbi:ArgE/DapE family deacylase [Nigerium massiliense]|uniref:ArgE/DapE family deacylase n=1 Tax=Nigerium massiliense TaxID=1522317 RepID=UPI00058FDC7A|nr:ArgE/DapE family deacylase [Nigerium massiliense]
MNKADLTDAQRRVLEALDVTEIVDDVVSLVQVPSVTGTDAESELQNTMAARLRALGMDVDCWKLDLDELAADPEYPGVEAERVEGYGLVAESGGQGVPALVLQGHIDVVPVGDLSSWGGREPFDGRVSGDTIFGRGTVDMKAGVAVNVAVAKALLTSGVTLERPFAVHQVISEEDGGLGAFATMRRGHRGEVAVITEPTSGRLVVANAGALTFTLRVPGLAAHGSTRLSGVSALEVFWPLFAAMQELEAERNTHVDPLFADYEMPYGVSIGKVSAGDWSSSVPNLLVAEGRFGVILGEDVSDARLALERTIADAAAKHPWLRDHPPVIEWDGGQFASGRLAEGHPLIDEVADAVEAVTGARPDAGAAPYGSDLRLYTGIGGIPTLQFGPGDVRYAHAPREQVSIAEIERVAQALAIMATARLGVHL